MQVALVVLDGWGLGPTDDPAHRNAVAAAATPNVDRYAAAGATGRLSVTGRDVGLPEGQMGNSEVGHLTIGAGRVVRQAYTRIEDAIAAGELADNEAIATAFDHAAANGGRLHLLGLVSDGGVHSDYGHAIALVELAAERGVDAVAHAITDGRDTAPTSGVGYLADLEAAVADHGTGHVATVTGRYYAMDRDEHWSRTKRAYDAIVAREADHEAPTAVAAVEQSYARDVTDEFVEPTLVTGRAGDGDGRGSDGTAIDRPAGGKPAADRPDDLALRDGDSVLWFNFRADRARQLTRMLADVEPGDWRDEGVETSPPSVAVVTMTEYDRTFDLPVAFPPHQPEDTLGAVVERAGLTQLRIAESEKYAHVTYFLNGGREVEFDGEIRRIVPSPDVPTYDRQPEMSAPAVTDTAIDVVESDDPDVVVLNYANPDMVGHTGDFDAAVAAVEAVDAQVGRLVAAFQRAGAHVLLTADHGNADDMGTPEDPHTAHTFNDVPFVSLAPGCVDEDPAAPTPDAALGDCTGGYRVRTGGILADVAPTMLALLGIERPAAMTGTSLLV